MPVAGPRPIARTAPTHRRPPKLPVGFVCSSSERSPLTMANGSLSALGPGGAFDLHDEGHTRARALAFVDRIQLERLHFELVNSQGPILPHPHPDAVAPGSVETGAGGRPAPATWCGRATAWRVPRRTPRSRGCAGRENATSPTGCASSRRTVVSSILAVCAVEWEMFLADAVVETHDRIVGRTYRAAVRTCENAYRERNGRGPRGAPVFR